MLRAAALVLALVASPADAESIKTLRDDLEMVDGIWYSSYETAMQARGVLASLHDSVGHDEYDEMMAVRKRYIVLKAQLQASLTSGDRVASEREVEELDRIGRDLSDWVDIYVSSSKAMVEKLQIALMVLAVVFAGGVFLIFRRRLKARK